MTATDFLAHVLFPEADCRKIAPDILSLHKYYFDK